MTTKDIWNNLRRVFAWSAATYHGRLEQIRYYPGRIKASFRLTPEAQKAYEMKLHALKTEKAKALRSEHGEYEKALTALHARYHAQCRRIETKFADGVRELFVEHMGVVDPYNAVA